MQVFRPKVLSSNSYLRKLMILFLPEPTSSIMNLTLSSNVRLLFICLKTVATPRYDACPMTGHELLATCPGPLPLQTNAYADPRLYVVSLVAVAPSRWCSRASLRTNAQCNVRFRRHPSFLLHRNGRCHHTSHHLLPW